jgi:hypothetical protein
MWVSPNHPNPPRQTEAPQEQGERLATFARGDGVELRVTLAEYQDRPYVALKVWERNQAGAWWPAKGKGVSIRLRELSELLDVLGSVEQETKGTHFMHPLGDGQPDRQPIKASTDAIAQSRRDHARARPPWDGSNLPGTGGTRSDFDECEGN